MAKIIYRQLQLGDNINDNLQFNSIISVLRTCLPNKFCGIKGKRHGFIKSTNGKSKNLDETN